MVSTQHAADADNDTIRNFIISEIIKPSLPSELIDDSTQYLINPTGRFVIGGPQGDSGLTGRKIIVDTYGGWGRHGGGAFSGKDLARLTVLPLICAAGLPRTLSPPDWLIALKFRWPTQSGILTRRVFQFDCFGTEKAPEERIQDAIKQVFNFKPAEIVSQLDLLRPIYRTTTNYGHFGKSELPWEQTDKVEALQGAVG